MGWREIKKGIKKWGSERRFLRFCVGFILCCFIWNLTGSLMAIIATIVAYEIIVS